MGGTIDAEDRFRAQKGANLFFTDRRPNDDPKTWRDLMRIQGNREVNVRTPAHRRAAGLAALAALAAGLAGRTAHAADAAAGSAGPAANAPAANSSNQVQVCVDVQLKSWKAPEVSRVSAVPGVPVPVVPAPVVSAADAPASGAAPLGELLPATNIPPPAPVMPTDRNAERRREDPYAVQPERFLKRMVEYEVTHEVGFEAVAKDCRETLTVEMYPLPDGWTVFARYTGTAREEKVDRVQADELGSLAQRLTDALLYDLSISETINRQNVLRADSEARMRMVDGRGYWTLALGTSLRAAQLPTASGVREPVSEEWRLLTPLDLQFGYRGKYQAWGLDAFVRGMLGLNERAVRRNDLGGHADYSKGLQAGLHFLRYLEPDGMNSTYLGGGASFELSSYKLIKPAAIRSGDDREGLLTGGLNADIVLGYEFMRASTVHFFTQVDLQLPTYVIDTENDAGGIKTYAPGAVLQIGLVF